MYRSTKDPYSQNNFEKEKKQKQRGITLPDMKLNYKSILIIQYHIIIKIDTKTNRIETPEIKPYIYGQLIIAEEPKNSQ